LPRRDGARALNRLSPPPNEGRRSAEWRISKFVALIRRDTARMRRGASRIGTHASRRSTLAIFGSGTALPSPAFPPEPRAASSRGAGPSARRSVSVPPEPAGASRSRGTPNPAPPWGCLRKTPLDEQGCDDRILCGKCSQAQNVAKTPRAILLAFVPAERHSRESRNPVTAHRGCEA
jgi:hypothetical protein